MNGTTLAHHTHLTNWCSQKRLCQDPQGAEIFLKTKDSHLSAEKYQSIGKWCSEVNRLFVKLPEKEPQQLFRKCKYTESMFPPSKSTVKSRSVNPPTKFWTRPGKTNDVQSAVLTGKAIVKPPPKDDEHNTVLSAKMVDTNDHYVQERRIVHLHIQPEWKRKLSTGWTINRSMLYPKTPPPPPPDNVLVDIADYLEKNEENRMEVAHEGSSKRKDSIPEKFDVPKILGVSEQRDCEENAKDFESEDTQSVHNKGTQWEQQIAEEAEKTKDEDTEALTGHSVHKPVISDRSPSNNILNVLSVDDCKMMLRYRPMRVIDTQDFMVLPPSRTPIPDGDGKGAGSGAALSEEANTATHNTPIRLSQGSARTNLTPTKVQSRVSAYKKMYNTYSKRTPEAKVQRPSSAAVERAFEVLLDEQFQACQSSRRPLSCPPKATRSRPSSRIGNCSSKSGSAQSSKFQQLNATLRQQMYDFLDSRWFCTKMKFQRTKNSTQKSAMKKGRMVTSSPKPLSWMSDEDLFED